MRRSRSFVLVRPGQVRGSATQDAATEVDRAMGDDVRSLTREQAQDRVDQIVAFRREVEALDRDEVLRLPEDTRARIAGYHDQLLDFLSRQFDIDRTDVQRQMSIGMRVASFLGALAFSAAVFLFFFRFWGSMSVGAQVAILVAAPLAAVAGVELAARREKTLYIASIVGLVALACFILDISVLATIFNITPSPNGLLAWAAFAIALAYAYNLAWLLFVGVAMGGAFVAAALMALAGGDWMAFVQRPEGIVLAGGFALAAAEVERRRGAVAFAGIYRFFGWVAVLFPVLLLAQEGSFSYLPLPVRAIELSYDLVAVVLGGAAVWIGIRQNSLLVVNTGALFLAVFLYLKLHDLWWDVLPRYLFFFLIGVIAVGFLAVLRRLRR
jgi:hypothetical protein